MKIKKYFKMVIGLCGIFLWFGTLTPEILLSEGQGCIFDEEGNILDEIQAQEFVEELLSGQGKSTIYKSAVLEYINLMINK